MWVHIYHKLNRECTQEIYLIKRLSASKEHTDQLAFNTKRFGMSDFGCALLSQFFFKEKAP